jgi:hypothetical protein
MLLLRAFAILLSTERNFSVYPSCVFVCIDETIREPQWTDFNQIWYRLVLLRSLLRVQISITICYKWRTHYVKTNVNASLVISRKTRWIYIGAKNVRKGVLGKIDM